MKAYITSWANLARYAEPDAAASTPAPTPATPATITTATSSSPPPPLPSPTLTTQAAPVQPPSAYGQRPPSQQSTLPPAEPVLVRKPIYLDYNATTPVDPTIAAELPAVLQQAWQNPSCSYPGAKQAAEIIAKARQQVSSCIGSTDPLDHIVFTSCATESINLALKGVIMHVHHIHRQPSAPLPHIVSSSIEHIAVLDVLRYLEQHRYATVTYLPVTRYGVVTVASVVSALQANKNTVLVTLMLANNELGSLNDIAAITRAVKAHDSNILVHTDASQAVGKLRVDITELNVDMLTVAGHKLWAPKGTGCLYIRAGVEQRLEKQMHGAKHERGLRAGTENTLYCWALGRACEIAARDLLKNASTMLTTRNILYDSLVTNLRGWCEHYQRRAAAASRHSALSYNEQTNTVMLKASDDRSAPAIPLMEVNTDIFTDNHSLPNTLNVSFAYVNASQLLDALQDDVACSAGSACHTMTTSHPPQSSEGVVKQTAVSLSHVIQQIGLSDAVGMGTIRLSTGKSTSVDEVREAAKYVAHAVIEQIVAQFYPFLSSKVFGA